MNGMDMMLKAFGIDPKQVTGNIQQLAQFAQICADKLAKTESSLELLHRKVDILLTGDEREHLQQQQWSLTNGEERSDGSESPGKVGR